MTAPPPEVGAVAERASLAFRAVETWLSGEVMRELLGVLGVRPGVDDPASWADSASAVGRQLDVDEALPGWLVPVLRGAPATRNGLSAGQTWLLRRALAVERVASAHFNFRMSGGGTYRERWQAVAGDLAPDVRARVLDLADELGLVSPRRPRQRRYDHTLVLGGGFTSPLIRARHAAELRASGVGLGEISFLGSPRRLANGPPRPERLAVRHFAPNAADEFDLMVGAARAAFGASPAVVMYLCGCPSAEVRCPRWRCAGAAGAADTPAAYTHDRRVDLVDGGGHVLGSALSASTGRPPYRPDTADTMRLWAWCGDPRPGQHVLVVTSQVFVPFQTFDGMRRLYLPHNLEVDTVGVGTDWATNPRAAENLLQETLSAVRSARRLLVDAAGLLLDVGVDG
ncbi:hypothetical protein DKT69_26175 [Micromonospora sicca]|uniref:Uncharacterized protein n=2 Tax=Micromonosporaceae TaxID=28056 RepID=A0A317DA82_9ACTN|nr:hypothetical protein DKT69_26175 [Micromonospora sp. 4G51]